MNTLIAEHMATLLTVSDGNFQRVHYPSEPVLAEAAYEIEKNDYFKILQNFHSALTLGETSAGQEGEIVGKMILQKAFDISCPKDIISFLYS